MKKTTLEKLDIAQALIIDVLDGGDYRSHEIRRSTGLPVERCDEIEKQYYEIFDDYKKRHNI